jgi:hypothetical protein
MTAPHVQEDADERVDAIIQLRRSLDAMQRARGGAYRDVTDVLFDDLVAHIRADEGTDRPPEYTYKDLGREISARGKAAYSDAAVSKGVQKLAKNLRTLCGTPAQPTPQRVRSGQHTYEVCVWGPRLQERGRGVGLWLLHSIKRCDTSRAATAQAASERSPQSQPLTALRQQTTDADRGHALKLLSALLNRIEEDRLPVGGWGRSADAVAARLLGHTYQATLEDGVDVQAEGSISFTRWVIDALRTAPPPARTLIEDDQVVAYLDERCGEVEAGSPFIGSGRRVWLATGWKPYVTPRHTASSILCNVGLGRYAAARRQVPFLRASWRAALRAPNEIGHAEIAAALAHARTTLALPDDDNAADSAFDELFGWLGSDAAMGTTIPEQSLPYFRAYALATVAQVLPPRLSQEFDRLRLATTRRVLQAPNRTLFPWGVAALLLSAGDERTGDAQESLALLHAATRGDIDEGFCVFWAALYGICLAVTGVADGA